MPTETFSSPFSLYLPSQVFAYNIVGGKSPVLLKDHVLFQQTWIRILVLCNEQKPSVIS